MSSNFNIFNNIIRNEDSTTELLTNLFYIKTFREKFLSHLGLDKDDIDSIKHENFSTQVIVGNSRPDIIIDSDNVFIVVEVKTVITTNLTKSQLDGYIEVFEDNISVLTRKKNKLLLFIVPKNYSHIDVIKNKINPNNINKKIITWEDIINLIEDNELHQISNYLSDFIKILKGWYLPKAIKLTTKEIFMLSSPAIPNVLTKLTGIVDTVESMNNDYKSSFIRSKDWSEYGIYFQDDDGNNLLYFGIWMDYWKQHNSPLCIGVDRNSFKKIAVDEFKIYAGDDLKVVDTYDAVSVDLKNFEDESIPEKLWTQIESLLIKQSHNK